ncbi:MAG: TIGR04086 family membrane protein, partial [Oscillospiraceae bacterium]|nr:TIGR04086 family membrane protein [Oscillospiraceae bacterium]
AALAAGAFCGGFASAKICGEKGFACGVFSGMIFFIVVWISGGIAGTAGFGTGALIKAAMIIFAALSGGIIGVNYIKRK